MRLIYTFLLALSLSFGAYAATAPDAKQITQELEQAKAAKPAQPETVEVLQSALNALEERKSSLERARQYQDVIDNFPKLFQSLRAQLNNLSEEPRQVPTGLTADALNQEILQVSSQLLESSRQAQQEQDRAREIADSLNQLPQQQTDARRQLNEVERRIGTQTGNNALAQAQNLALQAESARLKALVDELDVLKADKARQAWRKIIARMRYKVDGLRNGIDVTTTPEGFKFVYNQFVKAVREKPELRSMYGLVQASTFDNEKNLPDDYIPSLLASYPPELIKAYLNGQFTNLTSGTIYHQFDRVLNNSSEEEQPGEALYIGMDFNVGKMAGIVHVLRLGLPHAVTEIINAYDTPDMIRIIKERFWLYADGDYRKVREIYIYPDASGDSRKSNNASKTDIEQLRQAGFNVIVDDANPPVKDRINSMNAMFCNGNGDRRYKVNVARCPVYADCLEQQVWDKNGEPDKKSDNDHPNDGAGYFIVKQFPIVRPAFSISLDTTF